MIFGWIMIAAFFIGLYVFIGNGVGFKEATAVFGISIVATAFLVVAAGLISGAVG